MTRAELIDGLKHLLNHANDEGITEIHAEFVAKIIAALAVQQSDRPAPAAKSTGRAETGKQA